VTTFPVKPEKPSAVVETYLLGQIPLEDGLRLQKRLVQELAVRRDGQIHLLFCEHPRIITVGRTGSPAELRLDAPLLRNRQIEVRWVKRGGGCLVHAPGQLAVYPLVPLEWHGFSVGEYLDRVQAGMMNALDELGVVSHTRLGCHGIWGRTGRLAAFGVAVRDWVTYHGAFLNVAPPMGLFRLTENASDEDARMGCLQAERRSIAKMPKVRAALVRHLTEAFGCDRYHLYTGHPLLRRSTQAG